MVWPVVAVVEGRMSSTGDWSLRVSVSLKREKQEEWNPSEVMPLR